MVADVSMRGIRDCGLNLRVSVGLRSRNEVSYIQIDSEKGRVDAVDDLKAYIGVLGNALVVFHAERDALLACIFTGRLQRIDCPLNSLLNSGSSRELAREDTQVRRTQRFGDLNPFLNLLQNLCALIRLGLYSAGSNGCARKTYAVFEGQMPK